MIIKSITHTLRKSPTDLIKYIFDGRKSLLDNSDKPLYFKKNIRTYDKAYWMKQFNELERNRKSHYANKSIVVYHEVISFHPNSTKYLNRVIIKELVNKYIELRGNSQMVVGATHFEAGKNWHVHLIFSGIRTDNYKSARISQKSFDEARRLTQEYQMKRYPDLSDSVVEFGKKKD